MAPRKIDTSVAQYGEEDFPGSIRRATHADGKGPPWVGNTPGGREKRFHSPNSAWRWLRSVKKKEGRGQRNLEKRLDWVYRTYPPAVFFATAHWYISLLKATDLDQLAFSAVGKEYGWPPFGGPAGRGWARFMTPSKAKALMESIQKEVRKGTLPSHSPVDRAIPWFAQFANQYFKQVRRTHEAFHGTPEGLGEFERVLAGWALRTTPRNDQVSQAFVHWITQTRPNLQGVVPEEAYRRAMHWEQNQLVQKEYQQARAKLLDKSFGGVLLRLPNGEQLREIGTRGFFEPRSRSNPPPERYNIQFAPELLNPAELKVVGRFLGHCYKGGDLHTQYAARLATGNAGLVTLFSREGLPLATAFVKGVWEDNWIGHGVEATKARPTWAFSFGEINGPENKPVSRPEVLNPFLALSTKLWGVKRRPRSLGRYLAAHLQYSGDLVTALFNGKADQVDRQVEEFLFAPNGKKPASIQVVFQRASALLDDMADVDWRRSEPFHLEPEDIPALRLVREIRAEDRVWATILNLPRKRGRIGLALIPTFSPNVSQERTGLTDYMTLADALLATGPEAFLAKSESFSAGRRREAARRAKTVTQRVHGSAPAWAKVQRIEAKALALAKKRTQAELWGPGEPWWEKRGRPVRLGELAVDLTWTPPLTMQKSKELADKAREFFYANDAKERGGMRAALRHYLNRLDGLYSEIAIPMLDRLTSQSMARLDKIHRQMAVEVARKASR